MGWKSLLYFSLIASFGFARTALASEDQLTLREAIALAHERSLTLRGARARAAAADADVDGKIAGYLPTLSASVTGTANVSHDEQPLLSPRTGVLKSLTRLVSGTGAASLRWTVFDFGRTANAVSAARSDHRAAKSGVADTELDVTRSVVNAYVDVYYSERLRDVAWTTVTQREQRITVSRALVRTGLLPPVEEVRCRSRLEAAKVELANAEGDVADARAGLASLLALNPSGMAPVAPPELPALALDVTAAMRAAEALPGVRAAELSAQARLAAADAVEARYYPTVSLAGDGTYRFSRYERASEVTETRSAVGSVIVSVPLFDFSIGANARSARAQALSALENAREALRAAREEAARAALAVRATNTAMERAREAAKQAAVVFAVVDARYRQGLSSPLELIDAEDADADARVAFTRGERAYTLALVRAAIATGTPIQEAR